jgi:hypothetical protein
MRGRGTKPRSYQQAKKTDKNMPLDTLDRQAVSTIVTGKPENAHKKIQYAEWRRE